MSIRDVSPTLGASEDVETIDVARDRGALDSLMLLGEVAESSVGSTSHDEERGDSMTGVGDTDRGVGYRDRIAGERHNAENDITIRRLDDSSIADRDVGIGTPDLLIHDTEARATSGVLVVAYL